MSAIYQMLWCSRDQSCLVSIVLDLKEICREPRVCHGVYVEVTEARGHLWSHVSSPSTATCVLGVKLRLRDWCGLLSHIVGPKDLAF